MHKKGTEPVIWIIIEAVAITIAIIIIFNYINTVQDDTLFMKEFLARDLALMIDTVSTVPGEVTYTYKDSKANLSKFTYSFSKGIVDSPNKVDIRVSKEQAATMPEDTTYPFYYDAKLSADFRTIADSKQIAFTKKAGIIDVGKEISRASAGACASIDTRGQIALLTLDPADQTAWQVADYIRKKGTLPVALTRNEQLETEAQRLDRISESTAAVISISFTDSGSIKAFYSANNQQRSEKLACIIIKNLDSTTGTIIPSSDRMISKNTQGIGVKVEIGRTMAVDKAANALFAAVREYNG